MGHYSAIPLDITSLAALAAFIAIMALSILYIISITAPMRVASRGAEVLREHSGGRPEGLITGYSYPGMRGVLRSIYVAIRRKHCPSCTPRELASRGAVPGGFADLYEEIVYGGRPVGDAFERLSRMGLYPVREGGGGG